MIQRHYHQRGEVRQARHLGSVLRVCRTYKEVADSGGVVIQRQGFSTVDIRVLAIATNLPLFSHFGLRIHRNVERRLRLHRNQKSIGGLHQEARRLLPPDLHRVESACGLWQKMHNKERTPIVGVCVIISHQRIRYLNLFPVGSIVQGD